MEPTDPPNRRRLDGRTPEDSPAEFPLAESPFEDDLQEQDPGAMSEQFEEGQLPDRYASDSTSSDAEMQSEIADSEHTDSEDSGIEHAAAASITESEPRSITIDSTPESITSAAATSSAFHAFVPKTWRSEVQGVLLFIVMIVVGIALSIQFPATVLRGSLFSIAGYTVFLHLPLLWLPPAWSLCMLLYRIYNVRFVIHDRGLMSTVGILSFSQQIRQVRYEDIRSMELDQSLIERFLNVGDLQIGTAGTSDVEMVFEGVSHPFMLKEMIQVRRDKREAGRIAVQDASLAATGTEAA